MDDRICRDIAAAEAFDALAAEREEHLQPLVFTEPTQYTVCTGMRSLVFFGESGAGKTALRMALTRAATHDCASPTHLIAQWQPDPGVAGQGSPAVRSFVRQVLASCAINLLMTIARHPQLFSEAAPTAKDALHWFVQAYTDAERDYLLAAIAEEIANDTSVAICRNLLTSPAPLVLRPDATEQRVIALLVHTVQRIGLRGVWVMMDGFDPWLRSIQSDPIRLLSDVLSTLELFELHGFALKIFAPRELEAVISSSWGARKGRVDLYVLEWDAEQLTQIVERHIAAKTGRERIALKEICVAEAEIRAWFQRYGGHTPRGWLKLARPLVNAFISSGANRPLSRAEWHAIQRAHPPRLFIDLNTDRVFVGEAEISGLQPRSYRLLRYLYENRGRRVPRSELYYRAYQGLATEPRTSDDRGWEEPATWNNVLDNAILRLRKAIEPDPRKPIYILTDRGWGIKLEHTS
ncbi:winged helix-turn-helix domain-containing protein [Chloroflexus sp.]|uniref:winged helix-turn-helix domain-containing protein n=1 Tax=Chloroflexus sp. TaxID=1904827 RepID=UPI002FDA78F3